MELLPDANHEIDEVEPALTLYLALLRGLIQQVYIEFEGMEKCIFYQLSICITMLPFILYNTLLISIDILSVFNILLFFQSLIVYNCGIWHKQNTEI